MRSALRKLVDGNPLLLGVAGIGFAVSFQTVRNLAIAKGLPGWPALYPVGIDVGIAALIIESRHLIRLNRSDLAPRLGAWLLTGFTIYANVHGSAAHDWVGRGLHAVMPCLWVACLELTRRRMIASEVRRREGVPLARWLLAPVSTYSLWRRMVLWQVTSYALALEREQLRRRTIARLRALHGPAWRDKADSAVVWQLVQGIDVEGAAEAVSAAAGHPAPVPAEHDARQALPSGAEKPAGNSARKDAQQPAKKPTKAQAKKMLAPALVPYVSTLLDTSPGLTQTALMEDLHIGIGKAREALRLAKRDRLHAVSE